MPRKSRLTVKSSCLAFGLLSLAGIVVWPGQASAQDSIYVDYYTPQFFIDHLVFYDGDGTPLYYEGDTPYSVPRDYDLYDDLVAHYRADPGAYHRWYEEVGYRHLNYRLPVETPEYRPLYYLGYIVYYDAGGRPFYYLHGTRRFVLAGDPEHHRLVVYYRSHRPRYLRWLASRGRYLRWYRRPLRPGYYRPLYHNGYLVFFDHAGLPLYHVGQRVVYIPRSYPGYQRYIAHYAAHRANYRRWYREEGARFHGYRQPAFRWRRVVNHRAPRAVRGRAAEPPPQRHRVAAPPPPRGRVAYRPPPPQRHRVAAPPPPRGRVAYRPPPPQLHRVAPPPPPRGREAHRPPPPVRPREGRRRPPDRGRPEARK
jgi:hypothetical protein